MTQIACLTLQRADLRRQESALSWKILCITSAMSTLMKASGNLNQLATDYSSDDALSKTLQQRQYKLKILEEQLSRQKEEAQTQLQGIRTEIQSVNQAIDSQIKDAYSFRY